MLEAMLEGWRGKRVLIVGKPDGLCAFLTAMLEEIGARLMRVGDRADAQALCRALTALYLRMNPFRLYAFAGVALGMGAYAATAGRLFRALYRLKQNCVKKVK